MSIYPVRTLSSKLLAASPAEPSARTVVLTLRTARYRPPHHRLALKTSIDGWSSLSQATFADGRWTFVVTVPAGLSEFDTMPIRNEVLASDGGILRIVLAGNEVELPENLVRFIYRLSASTTRYAPNHALSARVRGANPTTSIGSYQNGAWHFHFDASAHPDGVEVAFIIDAASAASPLVRLNDSAPTLTIDADASLTFVDGVAPPARFLHSYDRLLTFDSPLAQRALAAADSPIDESDVIVIGSGMGGGILAHELSMQGKRTLVLEAGSLLLPTHASNLTAAWEDLANEYSVDNFVNAAGSGLLGGTAMNIGGRSLFWWGLLIPLQNWEYRYWPQAFIDYVSTSTGHPAQSGYERAAELMSIRKYLGTFQTMVREEMATALADLHIEDLPRSRQQPNIRSARQLPKSDSFKSTGLFSTADLLLEDLRYGIAADTSNLAIRPNMLATELELDGDKVIGVHCQDLVANAARTFRGSQIVLACGSIESPRLALQSGLADPTGKIGHGLTDHTVVFSREFLLTKGSRYADPGAHAEFRAYWRDASEQSHAFNIEVWINPAYFEARYVAPERRAALQAASDTASVRINFYLSRALNEENYVRLTGGKPEVRVLPNDVTAAQRTEIVQTRNLILQFLEATDYSVEWDDREWEIFNQGTSNHAAGSLRMSDTGTGVVDADWRFEAYSNLYCCDPSVFPYIPTANPSLTLGAGAQRLAHHLANLIG